MSEVLQGSKKETRDKSWAVFFLKIITLDKLNISEGLGIANWHLPRTNLRKRQKINLMPKRISGLEVTPEVLKAERCWYRCWCSHSRLMHYFACLKLNFCPAAGHSGWSTRFNLSPDLCCWELSICLDWWGGCCALALCSNVENSMHKICRVNANPPSKVAPY